MNLLDQKLKEKLKLFEDIDKQLITSKNNNTIKQIKKKNNKSNEIDNQQKNIINNFDNIYSNFNINNNEKDKKKLSKKHIKKSKSKSNLSRDNSFDISQSNSTKHSKILSPPNNSGDRLYNYNKYYMQKKKKIQLEEEKKIHLQMIPKILKKSKNIKRDLHFEQRLYYKRDSSPCLSRKSNSTKTYDNQFEYKPKLDKKSLEIANKLEPSSSRLLNTKKSSNSRNRLKQCSFYSLTPKNRSTSKGSLNSTQRVNELYKKGMEDKQRREKIYRDNKIKKEREYKNYSYKPLINKKSPLIDSSSLQMSHKDIYQRQTEWKKKLDHENKKKRENIQKAKDNQFSFKPEISHLNIQNDEKFIMHNIQQMNSYVNKRREVIQKQKELENFKNKRLGSFTNFNLKPTIPKEFILNTAIRNAVRKKSQSKSPSQKIINTKSIRDKLGINNFFQPQSNINDNQFVHAVNHLSDRINNMNL